MKSFESEGNVAGSRTVLVQQLFAVYGECLDEGRLDAWLELFTDDCRYEVVARENVERKLPLAAIRCESKGMLADRVVAARELSMYGSRYFRHVIGIAHIRADAPRSVSATASYALFQTMPDEYTTIFSVGRYETVIVEAGADIKFSRVRCVFDSTLVPNSIVQPI